MFHHHIVTSSGYVVSFDDAFVLMDKTLLDQVLAVRRDGRAARREGRDPQPGAEYDGQWVWENYCRLHREHYGEGFGPDVTPGWGGSGRAPADPWEGRPHRRLGPVIIRTLGHPKRRHAPE